MFQGWDSFFLLVGGAGGGLIGLLFVVVSLVRGPGERRNLRASSIYMTPSVFHLAAVLVLSAVADAPLPPPVIGAVIATAALVGAGFSLRTVTVLGPDRSFQPSHWTDIWCYGLLPLAACAPLAGAATAVWLAPAWAAPSLATALVALLLIAIRNAWDLVTWLSARGEAPDGPGAEP